MGKRDRERIRKIESGEDNPFRNPTDTAPTEEEPIAEAVAGLKVTQRNKVVDRTLKHIRQNYNPSLGKRFKNTDEEVAYFLKEVGSTLATLYQPYIGEITEICRNWRKKYGLPL